jgi:hypothetical protein
VSILLVLFNTTIFVIKKFIESVIMVKVLNEVDHLLVGLPMLTCVAAGVGFGLLQQVEKRPLKAVGWLGTRAAIVLGAISGVPLLIYSLAKVIFAKALNVVTRNHFASLKSFEKHAELQFTVTLVTVSTLPVIVLALPQIIKKAHLTYQALKSFQKLKAVGNEFLASDLYKSLKDCYTQFKPVINSMPQIADEDGAVEQVEVPAI